MTDEQIQQQLEQLEAAVSTDGADVIFNLEYEEQGCELIGNRAGYLRLAIEMLKAATVPLRPGDSFTPIQIDYLLHGRGMQFKRIVRQEDVETALPPPVPPRTARNRVAAAGCMLVLAFMLICVITGFLVVIGWIFR
jgi:hypothetical protein